MKKKVLSLSLVLTLCLGLVVPAMAAESGFTDVDPNAYYAEAVAWAVENNITSGVSATMFSPDQTCTRAQIATFIWRAKGCPDPSSLANIDWNYYVPDVPDGTYYTDAARWMSFELDHHIGYEDKTTDFRPNDPCTRLEAVEFLYPSYGCYAVRHNFSDVADSEAIDWASSWGVTAGTSETTFSPDQTCTRGQIVTFLHRAVHRPVVNDVKEIEGIYVLESNPNYELKVQYSSPRFYVVLKNRKYDKIGMTGNFTIASNLAFSDESRIIFYPGYLIYEYEGSSLSGKYILESKL